jgi:hypothetical protein
MGDLDSAELAGANRGTASSEAERLTALLEQPETPDSDYERKTREGGRASAAGSPTPTSSTDEAAGPAEGPPPVTRTGIYYFGEDNKPYYAEPQWRPFKDPLNTLASAPDLLLSKFGPALPVIGAAAGTSGGPAGEAGGAALGNQARQWGAQFFTGQERSASDMWANDVVAAGQQLAGRGLGPIWPGRSKISGLVRTKLNSLAPQIAAKIAPLAGRASESLRDSLASCGLDRFVANSHDPYAAGDWIGLPSSITDDAIYSILYGNALGRE